MAAAKTTEKQRKKNLLTGKEGNKFTSDNQPTPEQKSKGWQERRAEKLLTQKIIEKLTEGTNLEEYIDSLIKNAKAGNPKAIDTINNGLEEQVSKTEVKVDAPLAFIVTTTDANLAKDINEL